MRRLVAFFEAACWARRLSCDWPSRDSPTKLPTSATCVGLWRACALALCIFRGPGFFQRAGQPDCIGSTTMFRSFASSARLAAAAAKGGRARVAAAGAAGVGAAVVGATVALADDELVHPPSYNWHFTGPFSSFDSKAIRRGLQVYTQVRQLNLRMKFSYVLLRSPDRHGVCEV